MKSASAEGIGLGSETQRVQLDRCLAIGGAAVLCFAASGAEETIRIPQEGGALALGLCGPLVLALLVLTRRELWRSLLLGAVVGQATFAACVADSYPWSAAQAFIAPLEGWAAAWLLCGRRSRSPVTGALRGYAYWVGVAGVIFGIGASLRALAPTAASDYWMRWVHFYGGGFCGALLALVVLLLPTAAPRSRRIPGLARAAEAVVLTAGFVEACWAVFGRTQADLGGLDLDFVLAPLLAWAALRFGMRGVALSCGALALGASASLVYGTGPFATTGVPTAAVLVLTHAYTGAATVCATAIAVVIDSMHRAERALSESEERYRVLFEGSGEGVTMTDLDERFVLANPAAEAIFGVGPGELAGVDLLTYIPEDSHAKVRAQTERRRAGEAGSYQLEIDARDGVRKVLHLTVTPTRDSDGGVIGCTAIFRDITSAKRLEARVRQAQKLESLALLAAGVAHDFNNLLAGVLASASSVLADLDPGTRAYSGVQRIRRAARRAGELAERILVYSGRRSAANEAIHLSQLVSEMVDLVGPSVSRSVEIRQCLAAELPAVAGDPTQLRQIAVNLVTNASDAMQGESGVITLRTGVVEATRDYLRSSYVDDGLATGAYVYLEVEDTGCGIGPEHLQRIFDPFYSTKSEGRGLGMATVLGIVRSHGGTVFVNSEVGVGTTIRVLFPAGSAPAPRAHALPAPPADDAVSGARAGLVLVADDDSLVRQVTCETLQARGYQAVAVDGGREAVRAARSRREEIVGVVLDLNAPGQNALDAVTELRAEMPSVPIVLSSAYCCERSLAGICQRASAQFLQKPYTPDELVACLRRASEGAAQSEHTDAGSGETLENALKQATDRQRETVGAP